MSRLPSVPGLLHDIGKALTQEVEGSHVQLGVDIAKKYKENREIVHAIEAHHGDVEPQTLVAMIVDAADDLSAARPRGKTRRSGKLYQTVEKAGGYCKQLCGCGEILRHSGRA